MKDIRLTAHFSLSEFTKSQKAIELGLDNQPQGDELGNLVFLAHQLEKIRALLNAPVLITSGFRSHTLNSALSGAASSDHTRGLAADFIAPKFGCVRDICHLIQSSDIAFDQLVFEQRKKGGILKQWIHFGIGARMRHQVLSWNPKVGFVFGVKVL